MEVKSCVSEELAHTCAVARQLLKDTALDVPACRQLRADVEHGNPDSCKLLRITPPCGKNNETLHGLIADRILPTVPPRLFACLSDHRSDTFAARSTDSAVCKYRFHGRAGYADVDLEGRARAVIARVARGTQQCLLQTASLSDL